MTKVDEEERRPELKQAKAGGEMVFSPPAFYG
jgi:hypothetical protein